ncbi:hypothetical protein [Sediminibacterium sp.]|uniref:hypothetical protein n=1 Tax=Sediminibacterium sp. TaxID=1917865 RepID=UPI0026001DAE|nr:hypothetical protein [Sediminibacterium sp.]MBW0179188.1 hypothetical protein [Sediminibacterium sp.]
MEANILKGVYVRVGGEAGKTNGLSLRIVENMFEHLQELIRLLAKYELETNKSPDLKDFDIELYDFKPGSAVPAFRIRQSLQISLPNFDRQKEVVAEKFDSLMALANSGKYEDFFENDQLPEVKHEIAEELYGFLISPGNSPLSIVKPKENSFEEIYKIPKFTKDQSERLLKPKVRRLKTEEPEKLLALVQRIGKRRTIVDVYENKDTILSIAPKKIITDEKIYHLHTPLLCTVHKEDGNFVIENEMLDLYAAGPNIDLAEHDLYKEFDASYSLLNSLNDSELSERLLRAKIMMNSYIKEITKE